MTWGEFFLGLLVMTGGFLMVYRAAILEQWLGEVNYLLGFQNSDWLNWKSTGIFFLIIGFLLATGLFATFFIMFFGRFLFLGGV